MDLSVLDVIVRILVCLALSPVTPLEERISYAEIAGNSHRYDLRRKSSPVSSSLSSSSDVSSPGFCTPTPPKRARRSKASNSASVAGMA